MRMVEQSDWRMIARLNVPGEADGEQWQPWSPREVLAPSLSHGDQGVLQATGAENETSYGSWRRTVQKVRPGAAYRLTAQCECEGVERIEQSVFARLHWLDEQGGLIRPVDNALVRPAAGGSRQDAGGAPASVDYQTVAPEGADRLIVDLGLRWTTGTVRWGEVVLYEADKLPYRLVKLATVFHRPRNTRSPADSVAQFRDLIESQAPMDCDLICLPEGITLIGTGQSFAEVAEPVPGPTTETLGALARRRKCYIVAGLYEQVEDDMIYNTAVLIDRDGQVAGRYRKTHLPQEESDMGLTPGPARTAGGVGSGPGAGAEAYPVFQTDFGTVGIIVCWDVQFPEPAREMAAAGAEVILLPIWGGSEVVTRARAIENHVFLVSSSYDMRTMIVDPSGKVLAEASSERPIVTAEVDLNLPIYQPWLGDMRCRTWTERRCL
jgi:predicted amidohydrolase